MFDLRIYGEMYFSGVDRVGISLGMVCEVLFGRLGRFDLRIYGGMYFSGVDVVGMVCKALFINKGINNTSPLEAQINLLL